MNRKWTAANKTANSGKPRRLFRHSLWLAATLLALLVAGQIQLGTLVMQKMALPPTAKTTTAATVRGRIEVDPRRIISPSPHRTLAQALGSYTFLANVGGIAFDAVAVGRNGLQIVGLAYDQKRPDGERLAVTLRSPQGDMTEAVADLHDWQLLPIAIFADSDQFECFTLFGRLADGQQMLSIVAQGGRFLQYHPAFLDSLMGLRLLQADLLILISDACHLPVQDGKLLLGNGETPPAVEENRRRLVALHDYQNGLRGGPFRSYVICDVGQEVSYAVEAGKLQLTGTPFWYCWKSKYDDRDRQMAAQDEANRVANQKLQAEFDRDRQSLSTSDFNRKYTSAYQTERQREFWDQYMSRELVVPMPEYSKLLSQKIRSLQGINPPVYAALCATMRFAALFRAAKNADPDNYRSFMDSLAKVCIAPAVETPNFVQLPVAR